MPGFWTLEDRVFHKVACIAKLLGTHLSMVHKKVKFSWQDNYSPLALKGLKHFVNDGFYSDLKIFCTLCEVFEYFMFILHWLGTHQFLTRQ